MSSKRGTKLLAMALCVAMALSLVCVPALGAAPMMGETAVAETVPEDVGTMPEVPVRRPAVEPEAAEVSSASDPYSHNFTTDGDTSTFYTFNSPVTTLDAKCTERLTGEYAQYKRGLELVASDPDITFTAPADGTVTFWLVHPSEAKAFRLYENGQKLGDNVTMSGNPCTHTFNVTAGKVYGIKKNNSGIVVLAIRFHAHSFGEYIVDPAPTCTTEGVKYRVCSAPGCDLPEGKESVPMEKLPHTPVNVAAVPAKCTLPGATAGTKCSVCDTVLTGCEVIPATGEHKIENGKCTDCGMPAHTDHDWDTGEVTKAATCTDPGETTFTCTVINCGATKTEPIDALGHDYVDHPAKVGTCTEKSWAAYQTCKRCDYSSKVEVPAPGHKDADGDGLCDVCGQVPSKPLQNAGGWFETLYAVLPGMTDADVTAVSYSGTMSGELQGEDFEYLVRDSADGVRVDIPGIPAGTYTLKITTKDGTYEASEIEVLAHDRSGYAHWGYTEGVGAYRDDGILKENAIVLYVTEETKNTVTVESMDGTTVTGIGHILGSTGMDNGTGVNSKGGLPNDNQDILRKLADDDTPLVVRIVGSVKNGHPAPQSGGIDGLTAYNSADYGGTKGDNGSMARMSGGKNITIEGIGPDAVMDGWGLHFICQTNDYAAGRGKSFEVRNLAFKNVPEDCIGMEGQQSGSNLTAPVERCWVHNCAFYKPAINPCAAGDKDGGDGACDFKRGQYMTMDYCYYEGYHKTNLVGANDDNLQFHITWHHDYWKDCEARGPLGRQANMHIYNCIYDGQTSYAMNPRANCYIFSEYNTFLNCKDSMTIKSGAIKSYHDSLVGCGGDKDGTVVTDKTQAVPCPGNRYAGFELDSELSYIPFGDYKLDAGPAAAKANIVAYGGPMKAQPIRPDEVDTSVADPAVELTPITLPLTVSFSKTYDGKADNVFVRKTGSGESNYLKLTGSTTGQDIMFLVDEADGNVDITVTDGNGNNPVSLLNANGEVLLTGSGVVANVSAGVYMIQSSVYDGTKFKDAAISGLKVEKTKVAPHVHEFTGWTQKVAPSCTRTGVELGTCACGETQTREMDKVEHVYEGGACKWCGLLEGTLGGGTVGGESVAVTGMTWKLEGTDAAPTGPIELEEGNRCRLIATVAPANATNKTVNWESSDAAVATVARNGTITARGAGEVVITATTADGGFSQSVTVKVVGIITHDYTFSATAEPAQPTDNNPVADGTKKGTDDFFTIKGTTAVWRTKNKTSNKATASLQLGSAASSYIEFTVPAGVTARKVTVNVSSTDDENTSAIALKGPDGELVSGSGGRIAAVQGRTATPVTFEYLSPGTYQILVPANITPDDIGVDAFAGGDKDPTDPNVRGARITSVSVSTAQRSDGQEIVGVESVTLDAATMSLKVGESHTLHATVAPSNASNKTVTWTSSKNGVATVAAGNVVARGVGTATITATAGGKSATCTVTVTAAAPDTVKVTGITIVGVDSVDMGNTITLSADVAPDDADDKTVTWTSGNTKIATVSAQGVVTPVAPGTVTITATANDGSGVRAVKTITVADVHHTEGNLGTQQQYHWTVTKGGSVTLERTAQGAAAAQGDIFYAAAWDKNGKFLGVKIIDATAAGLTAQLDSSWAHMKLIWTDAKESPQCQAAEAEK